MATFVFFSHDGFGLGHVRRNVLIARAIRAASPASRTIVVTGVERRPAWFDEAGLEIERIPPLVKDASGEYRHSSMALGDALAARSRGFAKVIEAHRPDVVLIDRHPFGLSGELRAGLERAVALGSRVVLGLRDVIDEPDVVRAELAGPGWHRAGQYYDEVLVYGDVAVCDHAREYGLPHSPTYCGWVVEAPHRDEIDPRLLAVTAGGGADGEDVVSLGLHLLNELPAWRGLVVAGLLADGDHDALPADLAARVDLRRSVPSCAEIYARAGATVIMAGYNSTVEALAAGSRPVLVPRRRPRREQAIRAARLAALGVADVVDGGATVKELLWLFDRPRRQRSGALERAGVRFDGAQRAAAILLSELADVAA